MATVCLKHPRSSQGRTREDGKVAKPGDNSDAKASPPYLQATFAMPLSVKWADSISSMVTQQRRPTHSIMKI